MNKNTKSKKHYSIDFFLFEVQSPYGPPSNFLSLLQPKLAPNQQPKQAEA